ncbi:unnamed protein product [Rhizophagus irregularis]|nr:unnamed protein product [Rhizophagus irregularis]
MACDIHHLDGLGCKSGFFFRNDFGSYGLFLDIRLFKKKILLFIFDQIVYPVISNEQNSFEFTLFNIKVSMLNNSVLLGKNVRYHVR